MTEKTFENFEAELRRLVANFHEAAPRFLTERFDEASLRIDFINPFFRALGWDMENEHKRPQSLREVQVETRFYDDRRKRADYVFRTDGIDRFVCEAKGPLEELRTRGAYQAQRYSYNLGVRVATLTNFAKFQIFILGGKPDPSSPWEVWKQWHYTEYSSNATELWELLSKEHVSKNGLETRIASLPKRAVARAGRQGWLIVRDRVRPVDSDFLIYIEGKRIELANHLLRDNKDRSWNEYDLNDAVQRILNQVLFIRISEDRDIDTGRLLERIVNDWAASTESSQTAYARVVQHFRSLDKTFNGSLFKPHFSDELLVSDEFVSEFIEDLSSEDSPYLFSTLPIEILGSVYERFLGKLLVIKNRKVTLETKAELRKAGGIYYTPRFIVDYIVEGCLRPALANKTPQQIRSITIIDIACGSGSFLISAFQYICDYLIDWYRMHPTKRDAKFCYMDALGDLRLTTHAKQEIILNNIFGVDLDSQAVEISIFSLYLKLLEGETKHSLLSQHLIPGLEKEKYLPTLDRNVHSGNSLIGEDYYVTHLSFDPDDDHIRHAIKPFDWRKHFAVPYSRGGFDVVIGNPPYRRELNHKELMAEIADSELGRAYALPRMDLWYYFVHRGLEMLKPHGQLSFITNSYWTASTGSKKLISTIRSEASLQEIFSLEKLKVFEDVAGQHMIFRLKKGAEQGQTIVKRAIGSASDAESYVRGLDPGIVYLKPHDQLFRGTSIDLEKSDSAILNKLAQYPPLGTLGDVRQGIAENPSTINKKTNKTFGNKWKIGQGVFALRLEEFDGLNLDEDSLSIVVPYHDLRDIARYYVSPRPSLRLIYSTPNTWPNISDFPQLRAHLQPFAPIMKKRRETRAGSNKWWHLHWPRKAELWESPKIVCLQMENRPSFGCTERRCYVPFSANVFSPAQSTRESLYYITAILNSKASWKWFHHHAKRRGIALEINGGVLSQVPIRRIDFNNGDEVELHDLVTNTSVKMHRLAVRLRESQLSSKHGLESQLQALDDIIDKTVYRLYGLTEEEISEIDELSREIVVAY